MCAQESYSANELTGSSGRAISCDEWLSGEYCRLAVALNNVGTLLHKLGRPEHAMFSFQEAIQARMKALKLKSNVWASGLEAESCSMKIISTLKEEERLLKIMASNPALYNDRSLDMFIPTSSRSHEERDDPCEKLTNPIAISKKYVVSSFPFASHLPSNADKRESAVTLYNMGLIHQHHRSFKTSLYCYDLSLSLLPQSEEPIMAATIHNNIAQIRHKQDQPEEALLMLSKSLKYFQLAVPITTQVEQGSCLILSGTEREGVANALSLMGRIHYENGDPAEALDFCRKALQLRRDIWGDEHIDIATTLFNISLVLQSLGELDDAIDHCQWFVDQAKKSSREHQPHVAIALQAMGAMHLENCSISKAVSSLTESLVLHSALFGTDHISVADIHQQLGQIMSEQGRYNNAIDHLKSSLRIKAAIFGRDHEEVATVLCLMGQVCREQGELGLALEAYEKVLQVTRALLGDLDVFIADMLGIIGNIYLEMGENQNAMDNFSNARRILAQIQQSGDDSLSGSGGQDPMIAPSLLQSLGIEFHPAAAAA